MENVKSNFEYEKEFNAHGRAWIKEKIDRKCIDFLENFGYFLCDRRPGKDRPGSDSMTVTQIRNVFGEIKRIESKLSFSTSQETAKEDSAEWSKNYQKWQLQEPGFQLLRPKVAYNTAREVSRKRKSRIQDFRKVIDKAHGYVENHEDFKRFSQFVEGIIAYHKVYGGKD